MTAILLLKLLNMVMEKPSSVTHRGMYRNQPWVTDDVEKPETMAFI